jgi:hypothetical protein
MSTLLITNAGLSYKDAVFAGDEVQNVTHFVFANVPNLAENDPVDPDVVIPTAHVVHSEPVKMVAKLNDNAVVMSSALGHDVGTFDFNWYGAVATLADETEVLIAVVHTSAQTKTKTVGNDIGNYSVKSIVWRSNAIAATLNVNLSALPWQANHEEFASKTEFDAHLSNRAFKQDATTLTVFKRHTLSDNLNHTLPNTTDYTGGEWVSVRTRNGFTPKILVNNDELEEIKRTEDNSTDTEIDIVTGDIRELTFVFNNTTKKWDY